MTPVMPHISVCICTFKRPRFLRRLLEDLARQETEEFFTYSIIVADNDAEESARELVGELRDALPLEVAYCVQPEQNIALTRNMALAQAKGDFIAFIDDDEYPEPDWLLKLYQACEDLGVDGVLGPVLPCFEDDPPAWVVRGGFCNRPEHVTGFQMAWTDSRTGNLLFKREILSGVAPVFRPQFGSGGEDRDFFRRMTGNGRAFVWCNEAVVHEWVPPVRWNRSFMLRRALLRGKASLNHNRGFTDLAKSLVAVTMYTMALPFMLVFGQHVFMRYLIKICDHAGKLLAFLGINPIRESYVTE